MINFTERNYLTVLHSYNEALLRKKNLEMTSATLKLSLIHILIALAASTLVCNK